ncbi:MAG TPA: chloride channel protein [Rubrivivax sp.]|nr:chloride channel protein [Rubrivivax sp.]HMR69462.1 chloride channel protein [Rubrivivax sp.]
MKPRHLDQPDWRSRLRAELTAWRPWVTRVVVLAFAAAAGLVVAGFTWLAESAYAAFESGRAQLPWAPLLWMPLVAAAIVWVVRRGFPGTAGSGIPQVMAAMDVRTTRAQRAPFVSLRTSLAKLVLTSAGMLGGLSLGREGPSVQVAAGILHHARRWLPARSAVNEHGLIAAGGAAGIAAAFNTPLGGVMFAIETLARRPESRSSGLLIGAIVLAGVMAVSIYGNVSYFGRIEVPALDLALLGPGLIVALLSGLGGGLFARVLVVSAAGSADRLSRWRAAYPVRFAAGCALAVAVIGLATGGAVFGSGAAQTRVLLEGGELNPVYTPLKALATWLTAWSGVPAGVFAPSLAVGAGIGADVAAWTGYEHRAALIALGMAGFLAAVTQAPLTAFIIVMEMVAGQPMVLSLMACAMVASVVSRLVSTPLYAAQAQLVMAGLAAASPSVAAPAPAPPGPAGGPVVDPPTDPGQGPSPPPTA